MINNEILSFIKDQFAQGTTKDQVKDMLVTQGGWNEKDVEEAFETINFSGVSYPSILKSSEALVAKEEEKDKNSKDAFTSASELMKTVSNDAHPAVFSPGLSYREQPKNMEPSMPGSSFQDSATSRSAVAPQLTPSLQMNAESASNTGNSALSGMRARIASGVSGPAPVAEPASVFQPITQPDKDPTSLFPKLSVAAPVGFSTPIMSPAPMSVASNGISPRPSYSPQTGQNGFSPLPSLGKSAPMLGGQPLQPMSVFSKGSTNTIGSRVSPTPAQLATLQKQKGGRFLLGLMMFLIGSVLGGILMNVYMNGYLKTPAFNGLIEKGMNMIGLGTVTAPPPAEAPAPTEASSKVAVPDEGS